MNFFSALRFLTILPAPSSPHAETGGQILYFPVIGLLIGLMLWGVDTLGSLFLYKELRVLIDVLFLAVISGGLHLDGLADTADGVFSHKGKDRILEIMRDSRIGVMGALAVIFCLALKISGILGMRGEKYAVWLLAAPALGRTGLVAGLTFLDYARKDGGLGDGYFQPGKFSYLAFAVIPLALPFYWGPKTALIVLALFVGLTAIMLWYFKKKIGGGTGDTLGAMNEIIETAILVAGGVACRS